MRALGLLCMALGALWGMPLKVDKEGLTVECGLPLLSQV